ncbi:MAG: AAA family ATPase [Bacteroidia bacterium]|nr:AAA family ATPase [Bacteroidia bacterium]
MYIKKVHLENIKAIKNLTMEFDKPAGWHVLIGDNGSGKSTIVKAISLGLVGPFAAPTLRQDWSSWLSSKSQNGKIEVIAFRPTTQLELKAAILFRRTKDENVEIIPNTESGGSIVTVTNGAPGGSLFWESSGPFSAGYGPFRRFKGGDTKLWESISKSYPIAARHLSVFEEEVSLGEGLKWLINLHSLKNDNFYEGRWLEYFQTFLNESQLLPNNSELVKVNSKGVYFKDSNGNEMDANELSDGFKSILSLCFELIRQMILRYTEDRVFYHIKKGNPIIDLPGIVLIDEVDAHLHPTWQKRIGDWFVDHFPKIQFIVTTHSPIICQAARRGSVWKLGDPGSDMPARKLEGAEFDRLVYGNILEAYGTEAFGKDVTSSEESQELRSKLARLNQKLIKGQLSNQKEKEELEKLRQIFPTG